MLFGKFKPVVKIDTALPCVNYKKRQQQPVIYFLTLCGYLPGRLRLIVN